MSELAKEYRPSMNAETLHLWAAEAASEIERLQSEVERLKEDGDLCAAEWTKEIEYSNTLRETLKGVASQRDTWINAARRFGICVSCEGNGKLPFGEPCTDCLDTGWADGDPQAALAAAESRALALQGERDGAVSALQDAAEWLGNAAEFVGDLPDGSPDLSGLNCDAVLAVVIRGARQTNSEARAFLATLGGDYSAKSPAISTNNEQKEADCGK
jgi:hypothetical protein